VAADSVGQVLGPMGFGVSLVAGRQHGHKDVRLADLPSCEVDDRHGLAGRFGSANVLAHRDGRSGAAAAGGPVDQDALLLEAKDLADLARG